MIIAGGGFAMMAWRLAISRVPHASCHVRYSVDREAVERSKPGCFPVHREYYRILDAAWSAWNNPQLVAVRDGGIPMRVQL